MSGTSLQPVDTRLPATSKRSLRRREDDAPPSLLEFHSPSAALSASQAKPSARRTTWVVSSMMICCVATAGLIPIDKVVTAEGKVVSITPTVVVQPLETSIVRSIDVREGQVVRKGQLLAQLDPTFAVADAGSLDQQVDSLRAAVNRMRAEASGQPYQASSDSPASAVEAAIFQQRSAQRQAQLQNYADQIAGLQTQVARDENDAAFYRQRVAVAQNVEGMRLELQKDQVGSKLNSLAATDTRIETTRALASSLASAENERREIQATQQQRDAFDEQWRGDLSQQLTEEGRKLSDAEDQYAKATRRKQLVDLRAETDAVVLSVAPVSVGSVLQSGDQFFRMVPMNAPLEVEAQIPGREAGYVHDGDHVDIKFDTFAATEYGGAEGTVRLISADSFTTSSQGAAGGPTQTTTDSGPAVGQTYYRARITLDKITLHDTPTSFHIVPGMPIAADIKVGKRTVLSYMFSRVLPVAHEGMREP